MLRRAALVFALTLALAVSLEAQSIFTVAGGGTEEGRPATLAKLSYPKDVAVDSQGNLYIADFFDSRVRKVDAESGVISTVAGNGLCCFSGDEGAATETAIGEPEGVAVDRQGNLYISLDSRVARVDALTGMIASHAGTDDIGFSGDGGPATQAVLFSPKGLGTDEAGNLYIADQLNGRVRRVDSNTGIITTVMGGGIAGPLEEPSDVTVDSLGALYVADQGAAVILKLEAGSESATTIAGDGSHGFSGDGGPATEAGLGGSPFDGPGGIAVDDHGNLYIADTVNHRIRRVDAATSIISTFAGNGLGVYSGDGGPATEAGIRRAVEVAVDPVGNVFIASDFGGRIRRVDVTSGTITTVAGNGSPEPFSGDHGPATAGGFRIPLDVALDNEGNLFISDSFDDRIRKVDADSGVITTVGNLVNSNIAVDAFGNVYRSYTSPFSSSPGPWHDIVRLDQATGEITRVAGTGGSKGFSGDGGPATQARLNTPAGIALDASGNLFIADSKNYRVRRVDGPTGFISTVAGNGSRDSTGDGGPATEAALHGPIDVAVDPAGNLYIAEENTGMIRKVSGENGIITTIADLGPIQSVAVDTSGNVYVAESDHYARGWERVLRVDAITGEVSTLAGIGSRGFSGDNGPAIAAQLSQPAGIAVDSIGNLYIADSGNDRIRHVPACVALSSPALRSPSNNAQGLSTSPMLAWEPVAGAARYDVLIDTTSPPRNVAASDITTTTLSPSNLLPLTNYYWKVVAKGDPYCEPLRFAGSEVWSFTTTNSCDVPGAFATGD